MGHLGGGHPRGDRGRPSAAPGPPRGAEHRTPEVARPDRRRRPARGDRDHLLEPRRRRHPELHLPSGRVRAARRGRRARLECVQRPALLLRRIERDADRVGPRGGPQPGRRDRARAPEGHAGPERRGEQGEPANHRDGPERIVRGGVRPVDAARRSDDRHERARADRCLRERTRGRGPERDAGRRPDPVLWDDEPDHRPRERSRDRPRHRQSGVRAPGDPVHGPGPRPSRVQRDGRNQPDPRLEPRRGRGGRRVVRPGDARLAAEHREEPSRGLAGRPCEGGRDRAGGPGRPGRDGPVPRHGRVRHPRGRLAHREHLRHARRGTEAGARGRPRGRVPPRGLVGDVRPRGEVLIVGALIALAGAVLTAWGFAADTGMGKIPGPPVLAIGLGIAAASRGWARAALTLAAAFNLTWILMPVGLLNQQTDNVSVAFVMTGVILVGSGILIAVFNISEALRALLRRANRGAGRPVLKTAISYPMDKRFRTGMTVAMFALILFMVTLISMLQGLQASSLESFVQQQSGGYDVIAYTTTYSEIPNFRESLRANFSEALFAGGYNGTSSASVMPAKVEAIGGNRSYDYTLWGVDNFLIQTNQYGFTSFLPSYVNESSGQREALTTRDQVWLSLRYNHTLAIVDRTAAGPNQFVPDESRLRLTRGDQIRAYDVAGRSVNLTIVGVLAQALQFTSGVFVDESVVRTVFPPAERYTAYFFQMSAGVDVAAFRADLERVYFAYGLQTIDIREAIGEEFDSSQQVLTLMQAYLGIGILVGIAGLAVITLRAVVERRTQIGALRAIGFTQRMVLATFLGEIALIAVLGIGIGVALGIVFAYKIYVVYFADI